MNKFLNTTRAASKPQTASVCVHCSLPVPRGLIDENAVGQFCCAGCRTAYELIHACGLDAYYSMADPPTALFSFDHPDVAEPFEEFDEPSFQKKFGKRVANNVQEIRLMLDGIHCAACIWLIEKLPHILPGVVSVRLNWARKTAAIRWQADQLKLSKIAQTLQQLGYQPQPIRESENEARRQHENRRHLVRIGIAAAAAGNNMLIATALYLGMFSYMSVGMTGMLRVASCVVGLASLLGPGRVFLNGAWNAIRTRTPHMDLPIALGLTAGSTAGLVNTIRGVGEIYFDSLSVLIFLLLVGRWIQFRQQNRAADAVEMLYRLTPKKARKIVDGRPVETFVDMIQPGDLLEILPGDLIPVDGAIIEGTSDIDESILSGESKPLRKTIGQTVLAGTQNRSSAIVVEATETGQATRLSKIVDLVEQAAIEKPAIVQWANQIGGYFVGVVIVLSVVTFLVSWFMFGSEVAVDRAVALLIVACPCALALATPLAISMALGRAARQKLMIKSGDVLQSLNRPGIVWLDKTGTITTGQLEVIEWYGNKKWIAPAAALESKSNHAAAKAIVNFADQQDLKNLNVKESVAHPTGISGCVDQRRVLIGNEDFLRDKKIKINDKWKQLSQSILDKFMSPCWIVVDHKIVAVAAIGDSIRSDTQSAINQLLSGCWTIGILSGDHREIVNQVGARLGLPGELTIGGLTPEDKLEIVRKSFSNYDTVVMVGDGVNDSAALAAASVGIAVHNSAEASLAAAPVYMAKEGLQPILELIRISKSTDRIMRNNFVFSLTYNILGATMAAIGWINPLVAAILMPVSSLTVVASSLRAGAKPLTRKGQS